MPLGNRDGAMETPYDTNDSMICSDEDDQVEALALMTCLDQNVAMKKRKQSMRLVNLL